MRCWKKVCAEVWPRGGAEKWAVADGRWSVESVMGSQLFANGNDPGRSMIDY